MTQVVQGHEEEKEQRPLGPQQCIHDTDCSEGSPVNHHVKHHPEVRSCLVPTLVEVPRCFAVQGIEQGSDNVKH